MVFGFTGYLLPWDQRAYWATVVGTEIAGNVPVIGDQLLLLLRGGVDVTEATLSRFFGIHVLVMPLALGALLLVHLTLVHQLGLANPKRPDPRGRPPEGKTIPFFPNYILDELIAWYIVLALLVVLASLFPAGLEEQAEPTGDAAPTRSPSGTSSRVYEFLKLVPKTVGILLPIVGPALPVDPAVPGPEPGGPCPAPDDRRRRATVVLVAAIALTAQGLFG